MKQILIEMMMIWSLTVAPLIADVAQLNPEQHKTKERLEKLLRQSPRHGGLMVSMAKIYAAVGIANEAVAWLEKADASGIDLDLTGIIEFDPIRTSESFKRISDRFTARGPIVASTLKLSLTEVNLEPEGIAYDPVSKRFFLGSIRQRKIVAVDEAGRQTDFVPSGRDSLLEVLGLRVDETRRHLWACANGRDADGKDRSGVFQFNLADGRLIKSYLLKPSPDKHLFNDLVVTKTGEAYLSDSEQGRIWCIAADHLEPVTAPNTFLYINGLCFDEQGKNLFISDFHHGLSRLDLHSRQIQPLHSDPGICTLGNDGLYLHRGRLIGIQNACGQERIVAYTLDESRIRVVKAEVLERGNSRYQVPMTGAIAGDRLCFVAYGKGDAGRKLPPPIGDQPSAETVIMELELKPLQQPPVSSGR